MHNTIIEHIRKFIDLNEIDAEAIKKYIETSHFKKKEFILREGKICRNLYFVEKGCLRMFFTNKKGVEQITQFALDGWWISDFQSLMNEAPSNYSIQTIEPSQITSVSYLNLDKMLLEIPYLEKSFRIIFQKAVAGAQHRSKLMYEMSKEEFYIHFSTSFPEFMMRVPQYMIASYLGITPEYLSELRKIY